MSLSADEEQEKIRQPIKQMSVDEAAIRRSKAINQNVEKRPSSNGSDDSTDGKKPASLTEIQDLYCALQDLVKTNVTKTTPLSSPSISRNSPRINSPNIETIIARKSENLTPQLNRKFSNNKSESIVGDQAKKHSRHRRGLSAGTLDAVTSIIKKSPFPSRKISSDPVEQVLSDQERVKAVKKTSRFSICC